MTPEPAFRQLTELDRIVHEPARLAILAVLYTIESADFLYLLHATGLTKGNLSSHLMRLEEAGYIQITKTFRGKLPETICSLTALGRQAFEGYRNRLREAVDALSA